MTAVATSNSKTASRWSWSISFCRICYGSSWPTVLNRAVAPNAMGKYRPRSRVRSTFHEDAIPGSLRGDPGEPCARCFAKRAAALFQDARSGATADSLSGAEPTRHARPSSTCPADCLIGSAALDPVAQHRLGQIESRINPRPVLPVFQRAACYSCGGRWRLQRCLQQPLPCGHARFCASLPPSWHAHLRP